MWVPGWPLLMYTIVRSPLVCSVHRVIQDIFILLQKLEVGNKAHAHTRYMLSVRLPQVHRNIAVVKYWVVRYYCLYIEHFKLSLKSLSYLLSPGLCSLIKLID